MDYNVGDLVWIFIPIRKVGLSEKLMKRYFGPYRVTRKLSDVTFEVEPVDQPTRRRQARDLVQVLRMKPYHDPEDKADLFKRNTLEDDKHTGRPSSSKTPESIEKVRESVAKNRSASMRMMAEVLHVNRETIRTILHEDLGKTKVCAKFVPQNLPGEQKSLRIAHCRDIISAYENDSNFLKSIVTGDETSGFQYDPKTKRQSAEWKSKNSPQAKKTRKVPSKIKTMLITFFDSRGNIHKEFVPAGRTIT
ncbi:hypothetical protein LAZ67_10001157 [Cordylochernes scorpioides]|uniref:Integrase p58-like C-terminal domain-containing protein n=1 Tax=Cordylochernes scorpioides TaxID=51811 RepID=A0ABY6KXS7_9ARAC|nr:hypothetical protein LAZ67_10001157 [Cordylochernes scorpioides]